MGAKAPLFEGMKFMSSKAQKEAEKLKKEAEAKAAESTQETSEVFVPTETSNDEAAANVVNSPDDVEEIETSTPPAGNEDEEKETQDEDVIELELKVKNSNPNGRFRILDLVIAGHEFKKYTLTQAQFIDLLGDGPIAHIECKDHDLKKAQAEYREELKAQKA